LIQKEYRQFGKNFKLIDAIFLTGSYGRKSQKFVTVIFRQGLTINGYFGINLGNHHKHWEISRARAAIVRMLYAAYDGEFPETKKRLEALKKRVDLNKE